MVLLEVLKKFGIEKKAQLTNPYFYNCWGFTRFIFEKKKLVWEKDYNMEKWLKENTKKVKKVKVGDIGVMRDNYELLSHTFIVIDPKQDIIFHKCGALPLSYGTIRQETENGNMAVYGKIVEFRRFKERKVKINENYKNITFF